MLTAGRCTGVGGALPAQRRTAGFRCIRQQQQHQQSQAQHARTIVAHATGKASASESEAEEYEEYEEGDEDYEYEYVDGSDSSDAEYEYVDDEGEEYEEYYEEYEEEPQPVGMENAPSPGGVEQTPMFYDLALNNTVGSGDALERWASEPILDMYGDPLPPDVSPQDEAKRYQITQEVYQDMEREREIVMTQNRLQDERAMPAGPGKDPDEGDSAWEEKIVQVRGPSVTRTPAPGAAPNARVHVWSMRMCTTVLPCSAPAACSVACGNTFCLSVWAQHALAHNCAASLPALLWQFATRRAAVHHCFRNVTQGLAHLRTLPVQGCILQTHGLMQRRVQMNRVNKVTRGGRDASIRAVVIAGNYRGQIGYGVGKAKEVAEAIQRAGKKARENAVWVPVAAGRTVPHHIQVCLVAGHWNRALPRLVALCTAAVCFGPACYLHASVHEPCAGLDLLPRSKSGAMRHLLSIKHAHACAPALTRRAACTACPLVIARMTLAGWLQVKHKAARIMLRPAQPGAGVIAGGAVRMVLEMAGYQNVFGKIYGTSSNMNNARGTIHALRQMQTWEGVCEDRGVTFEYLQGWVEGPQETIPPELWPESAQDREMRLRKQESLEAEGAPTDEVQSTKYDEDAEDGDEYWDDEYFEEGDYEEYDEGEEFEEDEEELDTTASPGFSN